MHTITLLSTALSSLSALLQMALGESSETSESVSSDIPRGDALNWVQLLEGSRLAQFSPLRACETLNRLIAADARDFRDGKIAPAILQPTAEPTELLAVLACLELAMTECKERSRFFTVESPSPGMSALMLQASQIVDWAVFAAHAQPNAANVRALNCAAVSETGVVLDSRLFEVLRPAPKSEKLYSEHRSKILSYYALYVAS